MMTNNGREKLMVSGKIGDMTFPLNRNGRTDEWNEDNDG